MYDLFCCPIASPSWLQPCYCNPLVALNLAYRSAVAWWLPVYMSVEESSHPGVRVYVCVVLADSLPGLVHGTRALWLRALAQRISCARAYRTSGSEIAQWPEVAACLAAFSCILCWEPVRPITRRCTAPALARRCKLQSSCKRNATPGQTPHRVETGLLPLPPRGSRMRSRFSGLDSQVAPCGC
jgi:hypothetical protein